jgi:hypothetical protein
VVVVGSFARRMSGEKLQGAVAALLLISSYTFVFHSRRVLADPLFMLAMYASLYLWIGACSEEGKAGRRGAMLAGICLGLCVMTKWVFVLLPLLSAAAWHGLERRRVPWARVGWAGAAALVVSLPWHLLQSLRHGEAFWEVYAGYHVWARATRSLVSPHGPLFYFELLASTDAGFLILAGAGLIGCLFAWRSGARGVLTPWVMCLVSFAPLQLSSTKMPHYLLALVPMVALGTARGWGWLLARWRSPVLLVGLGLLMLGAWVTGPRGHIVSPDYSPSTKRACAWSEGGGRPVVVMNHYSPAATWYCDQPVVMHTDDPRFFEIQQSIDMMARSNAVELISTEEFVALVLEKPERPVITRPGHGERLRALLPPGHSARRIQPGPDADLLEPPTHQKPAPR